jgi:hypothetical protein
MRRYIVLRLNAYTNLTLNNTVAVAQQFIVKTSFRLSATAAYHLTIEIANFTFHDLLSI